MAKTYPAAGTELNICTAHNAFARLWQHEVIAPSTVSLFCYLVNAANDHRWQGEFRCLNSRICNIIAVTRKTFTAARDQLIALNIIRFTPGEKKGMASTYGFNPIEHWGSEPTAEAAPAAASPAPVSPEKISTPKTQKDEIKTLCPANPPERQDPPSPPSEPLKETEGEGDKKAEEDEGRPMNLKQFRHAILGNLNWQEDALKYLELNGRKISRQELLKAIEAFISKQQMSGEGVRGFLSRRKHMINWITLRLKDPDFLRPNNQPNTPQRNEIRQRTIRCGQDLIDPTDPTRDYHSSF